MFKIIVVLLGLISVISLSPTAGAEDIRDVDRSDHGDESVAVFEIDTLEIVSDLVEGAQRGLEYELRSGWRLHAWAAPSHHTARFTVAEDTTSPSH